MTVNTGECREIAEYVLDLILDDDNRGDYDGKESFELFQLTEKDDFVQVINGRDYVSPSHGIRFITDDTFEGHEVEYEITVKRIR